MLNASPGAMLETLSRWYFIWLIINRNDNNFDPRLAIIERIETYNISEYDKELEKEIYDLYFDNYRDIYNCKYNCGFKGLYNDVIQHEKKYKKTFKK